MYNVDVIYIMCLYAQIFKYTQIFTCTHIFMYAPIFMYTAPQRIATRGLTKGCVFDKYNARNADVKIHVYIHANPYTQ